MINEWSDEDVVKGPPAAPDMMSAILAGIKHVESRGNPNAVSPKGAVGTMQTMPTTLRNPGFGVTPAKDNSPAELERVGQDYYKAMYSKYGNHDDALRAYNFGPANYDKHLTGKKPLPKETQDYVPLVHKAAARIGAAPVSAGGGVLARFARFVQSSLGKQNAVKQ